MTEMVSEQTCRAYREGIIQEIKSQVEKLELLSGKGQEDFNRTLIRIGEQIDSIQRHKFYTKEEIVDIFTIELSKLKFIQLSSSVVDSVYKIIEKAIDDNTIEIRKEALTALSLKDVLPDVLSSSDLSKVKILNSKQLGPIFISLFALIFAVAGSYYMVINTSDKIDSRLMRVEELTKKYSDEQQYFRETIMLLLRRDRVTYYDYCKRNDIVPCE